MNRHSSFKARSAATSPVRAIPEFGREAPVPRERTAAEQADGRGRWELCVVCGHGFYSCICSMPEPEPIHFKPAGNYDPDAGWAFAERSAFGMSASVSGEGGGK